MDEGRQVVTHHLVPGKGRAGYAATFRV